MNVAVKWLALREAHVSNFEPQTDCPH
jgi:hypothetical protein